MIQRSARWTPRHILLFKSFLFLDTYKLRKELCAKNVIGWRVLPYAAPPSVEHLQDIVWLMDNFSKNLSM